MIYLLRRYESSSELLSHQHEDYNLTMPALAYAYKVSTMPTTRVAANHIIVIVGRQDALIDLMMPSCCPT